MECALEQRTILRIVEPCRSPGGMREHHHIECHAVALDAMRAANDAAQLRLADQLLRRQRSDGDHQLRPEQADLAIEVG